VGGTLGLQFCVLRSRFEHYSDHKCSNARCGVDGESALCVCACEYHEELSVAVPAKSKTPNLPSQPSGFHTQWATG